MSRTVIVGDVHGCLAELEELLAKIGLCRDDRLYFVGDLLARGPDSAGVVALAAKHAAVVVRGNHEEKLLRWRHEQRTGMAQTKLSEMHARVARSLDGAAWRFLSRTPLWVELPEHALSIVHAGLVPGVPVDHQARSTLLTVRTLGPAGEPDERPSAGPLWGTAYTGPPHVVFGHNARREPQIHPWATGIDTACVYGGSLTAVVLREGERMPDAPDRRFVLVSVPAHRAWYRGRG